MDVGRTMLRQRLRDRRRRALLAPLANLLVLAFAAALIFYGGMLTLIALGGRDLARPIARFGGGYDMLGSLTAPRAAADVAPAVLATAGIALLVVCGYLALRLLPRPELARTGVRLADGPRGSLDVRPTAFERVAEAAAARAAAVTGVRGRYGLGEIDLRIRVGRARGLPATLTAVQRLVREALDEHGLPVTAVNVLITAYDGQTRRDLS